MPGLIDKTVRNLREVQPTMLFNVPRGFDMLLPFLEADDRLAADVLARMRLAFYAAAALPPSTWQRLQAVARRVRPRSRCGSLPRGAPQRQRPLSPPRTGSWKARAALAHPCRGWS